MNCPNCSEAIKENEIKCTNCESYLPADKVTFYNYEKSSSVGRFFWLGIGYLLVTICFLTLLTYLLNKLPGFVIILVLLPVAIVIFGLNSSTKYFDCPNCHAERAVLAKKNMIKSHCKYCGEKYEFVADQIGE